MSILVKWGRERLHFPLPALDTKLGALRNTLAEYTHLPSSSFKLIHAGAVMKDDNAPLSAYGIHANSTILLLDSTPQAAAASSPNASTASSNTKKVPAHREPKTEASTISQIRAELDAVQQTLEPGVDGFLNNIGAPERSDPAALEAEHRRLGELLLQALLRLDAIGFEGGWEDARRERKGAVKIVQGLLDRLDVGWRARARA
ncbi:hypothetical protein HETIRDRAFT_476210 [Heterobasidion irregulare TC 32-1]|uniref:BAG domain-containing protein n=1 Tax=Heterobasidion irregulare (strain TC 32-1) TaxID=747525 RepID=W4K410_HETIT|nr:uncharacterized protein HETIRDRAFT_476210 [Heterobasidion irregulare TC 32-1]ETW80552.1 hypothetical protein HETIRDRAFT_476210 [Heterobasidion irregulare TC 32-1]